MKLAAVLAIAVLACACRPASDVGNGKTEDRQTSEGRTLATGFTIVVPQGMTLVREEPRAEDFEVWVVMKGDIAQAGVYVGNAPSFPSVSLPGPLSPESDNPRTMTAPNAAGVERPIEFLWRTRCDWPAYIHAGALGDDTAVTDESAAIAASVRPGACPAPGSF